MNLCFFIGKIISNVEFKFIINNKENSIVTFKIQLIDNNIVKVKGYNEIADYCYKNFVTNDEISIYGELRTNGEIEIIEIA